jgi:hypothetical protein
MTVTTFNSQYTNGIFFPPIIHHYENVHFWSGLHRNKCEFLKIFS